MARVNVFLNDEMLKAVDAEAEQAGLSRSGFLQAALQSYLDMRRREREEAEVQRRMDEACKRMDALAEKLGDWDPVSIIREFRDSRYGGLRRPSRHLRARKRS